MRWGDLADEFLSLYPHATDAEAGSRRPRDSSDGAFWHMRLFADYQVKRATKRGSSTSRRTRRRPPGQPPFPAAHASEVPYVFDNFGELPLFPDRSDPSSRPLRRRIRKSRTRCRRIG